MGADPVGGSQWEREGEGEGEGEREWTDRGCSVASNGGAALYRDRTGPLQGGSGVDEVRITS
jgi:hypothetical protein